MSVSLYAYTTNIFVQVAIKLHNSYHFYFQLDASDGWLVGLVDLSLQRSALTKFTQSRYIINAVNLINLFLGQLPLVLT